MAESPGDFTSPDQGEDGGAAPPGEGPHSARIICARLRIAVPDANLIGCIIIRRTFGVTNNVVPIDSGTSIDNLLLRRYGATGIRGSVQLRPSAFLADELVSYSSLLNRRTIFSD